LLLPIFEGKIICDSTCADAKNPQRNNDLKIKLSPNRCENKKKVGRSGIVFIFALGFSIGM
jgi:hypothetical protein